MPPEGPETETGSAAGTNQAGLPPPASSLHSDWLSSTQGENAAAGASRAVGQPNLGRLLSLPAWLIDQQQSILGGIQYFLVLIYS